MESQIGFKPALKVFLFWLIFLILYGLYKAFPDFPLSIICGINESNFQHYKVTFFTMLILKPPPPKCYHRHAPAEVPDVLSAAGR